MWYYNFPPIEDVKCLPIYLISIGLHELQPYIIRPNGYDYDQFFYNSRGSGILVLNNVKYELPEGSAFFLPAGVPHEYYPVGKIWDIRWMIPAGYALKDLYRQLHIEKGGVFPLADSAPLDIIINKMHYELIHDKNCGNYFASGYVYEFIMEYARQTGIIEEVNPKLKTVEDILSYERHIELLRDYIEYHFAHRITLEELCHLISVSPQHLCRIFKRCTGKRPMEYVTHIRIRKSKELLLQTEHAINDISLWCGFENINYFYKCFKKLENSTPGEFRKQYSIII